MSNYKQKAGTGTLWKNKNYVKGGNQPYAKGTIKDLNGDDIDVALWIPKSDKIKGFNITMHVPYKKDEQIDNSINTDDDNLPF